VLTNLLFIANRLIDDFIREPKILCTRKDTNWMLSNIYTTAVFVTRGRPPVQYPPSLQRSQHVKLTTHWHLVQRLGRRALRHQSARLSASGDLPSSPPLHAYKLSHLHCFAHAVKWVALLHIREVLGSYPDPRAALRTGGFHGFARFCHTNAEIVPKIRP
jgi:hypothetical protein